MKKLFFNPVFLLLSALILPLLAYGAQTAGMTDLSRALFVLFVAIMVLIIARK
jgi:hypothetical protein